MNIIDLAQNLGFHPDIDGVVRIKSPDDAWALQEMARDEGVSFKMKEPSPQKKGMTNFSKMALCCYQFYPLD